MEIIRNGTEYRCSKCKNKFKDYDIPNEFFLMDSAYPDVYWYYPICPICREDLMDTSIYTEPFYFCRRCNKELETKQEIDEGVCEEKCF